MSIKGFTGKSREIKTKLDLSGNLVGVPSRGSTRKEKRIRYASSEYSPDLITDLSPTDEIPATFPMEPSGSEVDAGMQETGVQETTSTEPSAGSDASIPREPRGFSDEAGNFVSLQGDGSVLLKHTSGAFFTIRPDGAVYVVGSGNMGVVIASGQGGITLRSSGKFNIDAQSISMNASGPVKFTSKGQFPIIFDTGGDMRYNVGGSVNREITGSDTTFVGKDSSYDVFGTSSWQSQGEMKIGSDTSIRADSKITSIGAAENLILNSEGSAGLYSKDWLAIESKGMMDISAQGPLGLFSQNMLYAIAKMGVHLESPSQTTIKGNVVNTEASNRFVVDAKEMVEVRSPDIIVHGSSSIEVAASQNLKLSSTDSIDIDAGGAINLAGASIDLNSRPKDPSTVVNYKLSDPRSPSEPATVEEHWPLLNLEKNNWNTKDYWEGKNKDYKPFAAGFPYTEKAMSNDDFEALKNLGGSPPQEAQQVFDEKPVAGSPVSPGDSVGTGMGSYEIPTYPSSNRSTAKRHDLPPPYTTNPADTVGMGGLQGVPGVERIPGGGERNKIIDNLLHLKYNIADSLMLEFGDVKIARSYIVPYDKSKNPHYEGLAMDFIVTPRRNWHKLAEVAVWAVHNLPCKVVKIEKSGTYPHLHIESAEEGQGIGEGDIQTCFDSEGKNCKKGIHVQQLEVEVDKTNNTSTKGSFRFNHGMN